MVAKKDDVLDIMKGFTILLVVLAHVSRMYTSTGAISVYRDNIYLSYLTKYIYSFHMPVFIAISGIVYYISKCELGKYVEQINFIRKKSFRLLIPFIVFFLFDVAPTLIYVNVWGGWKDVLYNLLLLKDLRHLWFLVTLFAIFILFNFIEQYIRKYKMVVLGLFVILYYISPFIPPFFQLSNITHYALFFYVGYLFGIVRMNFKVTKLKVSFFIIIQLLALAVIAIFAKQFFVLSSSLFLITSLCGLFIIFSISFYIVQRSWTNNYILRALCKNSYGIYLFHPMYIYIMFYLIRNYNYNSWLVFGSITMIALVLSLLSTILIRISPLKFAIGE